MPDTPQVLPEHHLKALRLPTFLREHDKTAQQCAAEGMDAPRYLLRLSELELVDRERRSIHIQTKSGASARRSSSWSRRSTASSSPRSPALNKALVVKLARG